MVVLNAVVANTAVVLSEKGKKGRSCFFWICFHESNDHGSKELPRIEKRGIEYETSGLFAWIRLLRKGKMFSKKSWEGITACIHSNCEMRRIRLEGETLRSRERRRGRMESLKCEPVTD